jgi:hypothetical protein
MLVSMTSVTKVALAALLSLPAGCSYHLVSPPAHVVNLESAAPLKEGETIVGGRAGALTAIFDPGAVVAGGIVRHGIESVRTRSCQDRCQGPIGSDQESQSRPAL